jgi:hypothetical protein
VARRWRREPERLAERGWSLTRALHAGLVTLGAWSLTLAAADALAFDAPSPKTALGVSLAVALATFGIAPWRARASRRAPNEAVG